MTGAGSWRNPGGLKTVRQVGSVLTGVASSGLGGLALVAETSEPMAGPVDHGTGSHSQILIEPTSSAEEEAQLVAQMAAGDDGAPVTELYRRYGRRLFRFGVQMLGNDGLAEEMVQECFMRLWRTAGRFDAERANVGTYLFMIARSVALDIRRRPSSRPLLPAEEVYTPPPFDNVEQILDSVIVREALDTLSQNHRQVVRLAYNQGLTQSEIAERLGLPLGTVKTRMFQAMRSLRTALDERGIHAA